MKYCESCAKKKMLQVLKYRMEKSQRKISTKAITGKNTMSKIMSQTEVWSVRDVTELRGVSVCHGAIWLLQVAGLIRCESSLWRGDSPVTSLCSVQWCVQWSCNHLRRRCDNIETQLSRCWNAEKAHIVCITDRYAHGFVFPIPLFFVLWWRSILHHINIKRAE